MTEAQLHKAVVLYLGWSLPGGAVVIHIPNEGKRGWKAQRDLKDTGVLKGAPDLMVCYDSRVHFIELKVAKGRISSSQVSVHERLKDQGFYVAICRSLDDVYDFLTATCGIMLRARSTA